MLTDLIHSLTGLLAVALPLSIPLVAIVSFSPIGRAISERIREGRPVLNQDPALAERLSRLERHVSAMQSQLITLQDEHRFVERLIQSPAITEQGEPRQTVLA